MFPSLYGVVSQGGSDNWWEAGGATGAIAVYQPKGAASLAASYADLSGNGNDATLGVAPAWDDVNGWIFNGTQHLKTGIIPPSGFINYTVIVSFSNAIQSNAGALFGSDNISFDPTRVIFMIRPYTASNNIQYYNGLTILNVSPGASTGVYGISGAVAYKNGSSVGTISGLSATTHAEIYIGARSFGVGGVEDKLNGYIKSAAIYDNGLDSLQMAAVSSAMAAL